MSSTNIDVIRQAVDKLNAGDLDGYLAAFDPACMHWIVGFPEPMPMPAFVDSMTAMRSGLPDISLQEVSMFAVDQYACAQWRTCGTHTAELFGITPTQRRISFDTAEVYEVDAAGRVRTSWAYGDPGALFAQLTETTGDEAQ